MDNNSIEKIIARIEKLEKEVFGMPEKKPAPTMRKSKLDYSINIRAYVKRNAVNKSGPKKFVLLLAYICKGNAGQKVALKEISKEWKKMSTKNLMGKFNRFYSNQAKTNGWVDSKENGIYYLTKEWIEVND